MRLHVNGASYCAAENEVIWPGPPRPIRQQQDRWTVRVTVDGLSYW